MTADEPMDDAATTGGDRSDRRDEPTRTVAAASRDGRTPPANPTEGARYLLAATAYSLARLAFVSALPLGTLCLLVGVEALVGTRLTVTVTTATGEYAVPLTRALVVAVVAHLVRRLYALNAG